MCSIAGALRRDSKPAEADVSAMLDAMAHRGPDGTMILAYGNITLGHSRLAITDLSAAAAQPMQSADGRFSIIFNGAIYNYKLLRIDLMHKGYSIPHHF